MVRIVLTASAVVVCALALGGCASSNQGMHASNVGAVDLRRAELPEDTEFSFDDTRESKGRSDVQATSFRPNAQERPAKGAVHPATN